MKFCAVFVLAVLGVALATPVPQESAAIKEKFQRFEPYYSRYGKEHAEEKVNEFLEFCGLSEDGLEHAFEEVVDNVEKLDVDSVTICHAITENLAHVLRPITSYVDTNCNKNHHLGDFSRIAVEAVVSVVEHVCQTDGEHLLELLNPCLADDADEQEEERVEQCTENVLDKYEQHFENEFADKSLVEVVCEAGREVYNQCLKPELDTCKLQITKDSVQGFADALIKPCN